MGMFKLLFFLALAFLAAVGMFIGAVTLITSLQHGAISLSYVVAGKPVEETVSRAADNARFWRLMLSLAGLPLALGATALWYSVRKLRGA